MKSTIRNTQYAILITLILAWLILPQTAQAAEYYLDANNGNDITGDGSSSLPWKTFPKAQSVVAAGDIVYLTGDFGSIAFTSSSPVGTANSWITYAKWPGKIAPNFTYITFSIPRPANLRNAYIKFDGIHVDPGYVSSSVGGGGVVNLRDTSYIDFENSYFEAEKVAGAEINAGDFAPYTFPDAIIISGGGSPAQSSYITINNCTFKYGYRPLYIVQHPNYPTLAVEHWTITNNDFSYWGEDAITTSGSGYHNISNNYFHDADNYKYYYFWYNGTATGDWTDKQYQKVTQLVSGASGIFCKISGNAFYIYPDDINHLPSTSAPGYPWQLDSDPNIYFTIGTPVTLTETPTETTWDASGTVMTGIGSTWKPVVWSATSTYDILARVIYGVNTYESLQGSNLNHLPNEPDSTWWRPLGATTVAVNRILHVISGTNAIPGYYLVKNVINNTNIILLTSIGTNPSNVNYTIVGSTGDDAHTDALAIQGTSHDILVDGNTIFYNLHGCQSKIEPAAVNITFQNNLIYTNYYAGSFLLLLSGTNTKIYNNTIIAYPSHPASAIRVVSAVSTNIWSPATTYASGALGLYNGTTYVSKQGSNLNHLPDEPDSIWWRPLTLEIYFYNNIVSGLIWTTGGPFYSDYNIWGSVPPIQTNEGSHSVVDANLSLLFVDTANGDFRLKENSAAINFGNPDYGPKTDILGNLRDTKPDAGCYEYGASTFLYGDVNADGEISAYDAALAAHIAVELEHPDIKNRAAANVTKGDADVTAYDAALIAQRAVGLIDRFPVEG